ncbi:cobyric acid synthase [Amylibacter marinus]|uniref:Cobyric acid synthase n=1 Tax=Amylibacter marinus TaxID=1475483 RepID=A0ABQ5VR40_9RHOB|nr:cobyric acid synthase [Amylibacter marinus]GLQ33871.1 cobyric acid synthase [Amylibacter marinus]
MAKSIMIQGAGSNVGKSMLVAGLCRAYLRRGMSVRPFKPQNMSNNAAVSSDGGEIGRAQALQAWACGVDPVTDMNPVLLKPESETGAQVIVQGKRLTTVKARAYSNLKPKLMPRVIESYERLRAQSDLVIVEGAGSPAEINLRAGDIANMGFAEAANCPVILVGDIDRGGVIAQMVGTHAVLPADDLALIKGFMINKFRGDPTLFDAGYDAIKSHTGWRGLGVVPWFDQAHRFPAEDALDIAPDPQGEGLKVVVPQLSRIANFDDLDPLSADPNVQVQMIPTGQPLPLDADLILLPGSKSTIADLAFLREQGWDIDLAAHIRRGGHVLGICGGYQMLGREIIDDQGLEGAPARVAGLGHLDITTVMKPEKRLAEVTGTDSTGDILVSGYEIHIGETTGPDCAKPMLYIDGQAQGAQSADGHISGCYLHGIFNTDGYRRHFLTGLGGRGGDFNYAASVDHALDALADHLEHYCDLDALLRLAH